MYHRNITEVDAHVVHSLDYADQVTREAGAGLTAADIGRIAKQNDNATFWILRQVGPVTWGELTNTTAGGGGGGSVTGAQGAAANIFAFQNFR